MRYVVVVNEADKDAGPKVFRRYLVAVAYQSYSSSSSCRLCSDDVAEAFVFTERSAAEMAAVWIGGKVARWAVETGDFTHDD